MEKRVAVYNNNTGVIEIMSSLLAGEGLKMVAVTGRAQLQTGNYNNDERVYE